MNNKIFIKILKRKEKSFIHLPIEVPTIIIDNPIKDEKIYLPEALHREYKNFITEKDPDSYAFIKRGLDERHQEKNIRKYLIFSESVTKDFDEFITNFCDKYKISFDIE